MAHQHLDQQLVALGLSDKEAAVYIAALALGEAPMQSIAEKANIKRATTYLAVEALTNKGLMSSVEKGKKTYFVAESPENLARIIDSSERQIADQKRGLPDIISQLGVMFRGNGEKPTVRFYEGIEGLETIRQFFVNPSYTEVFSMTNFDRLHELFPKQDNISKTRIQRKIKAKLLYSRKVGPLDDAWANNPAEFRESRYMPIEQFPFEGDITICGNRVSISSFHGKPTSVLIEHPHIYALMKAFFLLAWKALKNTTKRPKKSHTVRNA